MILADSSVLIEFLRTKSVKLAGLLTTLPVRICGPVRAEVLWGARGPADRQRLIAFLNNLPDIQIVPALWDEIGDNLATLRSRGITVPFVDVVIATLVISAGAELWTRDGHFALMQPALPGLLLFAEPP